MFEHDEGGIQSALRIYVDLEQAVKFSVLKLVNRSGRTRRLSATGYVEWVLGDLRPKTAMHVVTAIDASSGALSRPMLTTPSSPIAQRSSTSTMQPAR